MKICCFVSTLVHDRGCDPLYSISVFFKNLPNHRLSNGLSFQVSTSPLISSPLSFILSLQRQSRPDVQANRQTARCWGQYWRKDAESQIHLYVCVCVCSYGGAQVQASHLFFCFHPSKQNLFSDTEVPMLSSPLKLSRINFNQIKSISYLRSNLVNPCHKFSHV